MITRNFEQEALDERVASESRERANGKRQAHELQLAELKFKNKPTIDSRTKIITVLCKAPTYPFIIICITILVLRGKPIPESFESFLR